MKTISTNSLEALAESPYSPDDREASSEATDTKSSLSLADAEALSGILVSLVLFAIYCLAGGVLVIVVAGCVLIIGSGLGIIWHQHFPYRICSVLNSAAAKSRTQSEEKIFLEPAFSGCY